MGAHPLLRSGLTLATELTTARARVENQLRGSAVRNCTTGHVVRTSRRDMSEALARQRQRSRRSGAYAPPPLVLVVEDNDDLREMYAEQLRHLGYRTAQAANGAAALEKAREIEPAVVLLDYHMPVMDGFEAARRLREDPRTRGIPLVLVTSSIDRPAPPALFDDRLDKPCFPEQLEAVIESVLSGGPTTSQSA